MGEMAEDLKKRDVDLRRLAKLAFEVSENSSVCVINANAFKTFRQRGIFLGLYLEMKR